MKLQNDINDKELDIFFAELRSQDNHIPIPAFNLPKKNATKIWKLLPIGIAASLLLGFWIWNHGEIETPLYQDLIIISLVEDENQEQRFVIEQTSSMDVWESPTASLLDTY
ncbi:hypothetical protein [Belliella pelovolcani]|uniref:Uncharacterized protein n=1 Tax=Belliella pelovolcani TaxID=529505 RepID=A0A1N7JUP2_9BACT|nr:hypothetical protein [Belliella pelovolcani]SIS53045.1 hypothetical protein SAMN05421761_101262 [Belliella pelovolcani]